MNECRKEELIISPKNFFPPNIKFKNIRGNLDFIERLISYVGVLREYEFWESERVAHIQKTRFKNLISYLTQYSDFWFDYLKKYGVAGIVNPLERLDSLPVIDRKFFEWAGKEVYVLNKKLPIWPYTKYSSGTSSIPIKIIADEREASIARFALLFRDPIFSEKLIRQLLMKKFVFLIGRCGLRFWLSDFLVNVRLRGPFDLDDPSHRRIMYKKICEAGPILLGGNSSLVLKFSQRAAEDKVRLPIIAAHLSSEPISRNEEIFIRDALNTQTIHGYSCSEIDRIGFQCPDSYGKFHIHTERVILEILDEEKKKVRFGNEGEIVLTGLDREITPIIRYAVGDIGKIVSEKCSCGRTSPLLEFAGRRGYEVHLPSGKRVRVILLLQCLNWQTLHAKTKGFQIRQEAVDRLRVLVVRKKGFKHNDEIRIRSGLLDLFKEKIDIHFDYVEEIPQCLGSKPEYFVPLS